MAPTVRAQPGEVIGQTRRFLDAYARRDRETVLGLVAPTITFYGGDVEEFGQGVAVIDRMLANDQRLWGGTAHIGPMSHLSIVQAGPLASLVFDAPFELGARPPVIVRFTMVWRRTAVGWRLVQSANATPSVGQSAEALLKGASPPNSPHGSD